MSKTRTRMKRFLILIVAMTILLSIPFSASAASKASAFYMRIYYSSNCSASGTLVKVTPSNDSGTKGTIELKSEIIWNAPYRGGVEVILDAGTKFTYTISSMKDGGSITLKYVTGSGDANTEIATTYHVGGKPVFQSLTGKIHMRNGSKSFASIWKIDSFTVGGKKLGIYFKEL